MFVRRLMKVTITAFCVLLLMACRDLFVVGGAHVTFIAHNANFLPDILLFQLALRTLAWFVVSLALTTAVLYVMIKTHQWIDRATATWLK